MRRSSEVMLGVVLAGSVGALRAFAGDAFPAVVALSMLDGTDGFRLDSAAAQHQSGRSVASAGDINGDSVEDLIIGAPGASPGGGVSTGAAYIVFGRDPSGPGGPFAASMSLGSLDGANGFVLNGVLASDATGIAVAGAGDVNGDGLDDVIVGARAADPNGLSLAGATFVVFGRDTSGPGGPFPAAIGLSTLDGTNGFRINGGFLLEQSGGAVASAGDVNGDGVGDVIIGAESVSVGGSNGGRAYVVLGKDTSVAGNFPAVWSVTALNGANGFILNGVGVTEQCGFSVACAGDVNGDGVSDLIVGAPGADQGMIGNSGSTYVFFGGASFPAVFNFAMLNGANGFRIDGVEALAGSGFSAAAAGDVNGDGVDDVAIGATLAAPGGVTSAGSVFVVYGRDTSVGGAFPATMSLASLDGSNGFRLDGVASFDQAGFFIRAGEINGDGISDLVIGAPGSLTASAGQAYVLFGRSARERGGPFPALMSLGALDGTDGFRMDGFSIGEQAGAAVSAGDFNADGVDDVLIGASRSGNGGRSYVVFGRGGAPEPCPGDLDGDGFVGFADLNIVLADFNTSGAGLPGDTDGDGDVDFADLNTVVSAFNTMCP